MRKIGMKGIFSAIIAWAAIVLLFFSLSSGLYVEQNDRSLLKIQAGRELSEKTENVVRLLDKATADTFYGSGAGGGASCPSGGASSSQTNFNSVLTNFSNLETPYSCGFAGTPTIDSGSMTAIGTARCSVTIGATTISESRAFSFAKTWSDTSTPPQKPSGQVNCEDPVMNPTWRCQDNDSNPLTNPPTCTAGYDAVQGGTLVCPIGRICCAPHEAICVLNDSTSGCTEKPGFSC